MNPGLSLLSISTIALTIILFSCQANPRPNSKGREAPATYLGFDRNIFPGKDALPILRKTFAFSGYWLSPPPGEKTNSWIGQRELLRSQGFGFLLLYRGPKNRELNNEAAAVEKGTHDAGEAAAAARKDGFPAKSIIFLDMEEGGRLPTAFHSYLRAWAKGLAEVGYRPGAYCSGMPVKEEPGVAITTADDISAHAPSRDFVYFIYNDACPPSPGCTFPQNPPAPTVGGIPYATVWQLVRSPRQMEFTAHCAPGYNADGNCYAPGDTAHAWFLDVSTANAPDPSNGR
ncbi:MAG TPA: glycoside hydrolase domain-containing protein [Candidatus Acidoferrum sp.]|nr:glycoside hydrolase domain-containing protein [Candidatus Acidoferrum sp.]